MNILIHTVLLGAFTSCFAFAQTPAPSINPPVTTVPSTQRALLILTSQAKGKSLVEFSDEQNIWFGECSISTISVDSASKLHVHGPCDQIGSRRIANHTSVIEMFNNFFVNDLKRLRSNSKISSFVLNTLWAVPTATLSGALGFWIGYGTDSAKGDSLIGGTIYGGVLAAIPLGIAYYRIHKAYELYNHLNEVSFISGSTDDTVNSEVYEIYKSVLVNSIDNFDAA